LDFGFSEEQEMLRQSARGFLEKECPSTLVRRLMAEPRGFDPSLWKKMAELGWLGLVIPAEFGGSGLTYIDLVVVMEEMGRALLPSPFIPTLLFTETIQRGASDKQKKESLPAIAAGKTIGTIAWMEPSGSWDIGDIAIKAEKGAGGYELNGTKLFVADAHVSDQMIVAARTGGSGIEGITLFAIETKRSGVAINALKTMDETRKQSEVRFDRVKAAVSDIVGQVGDGGRLLADVIDRGKVALAAEMMGGAQKVLDMTVEYTKVREQFGRPIGSFQAIQHKCANMMVDVESAKSATYYAAWAASNGVKESRLAAALAKAAASDASRRTAAEGIQVHGGIGFTWEHDMHLYFKRAKSSEFTFGDATCNRELVAQMIGL